MPTKLPLRPADDHRRHTPSTSANADPDKTRAAWRAQHREAILEPELPIIDPHHHLWVRPGNKYLVEDFFADAKAGHNIKASVFVECGSFYRKSGPVEMQSVGEVEFANGMAAMAANGYYGDTRMAAGIVGTADISVGADVGTVLDALIAAGGGRFRGIRVTTKVDDDEDLNTGRYIVPRGLMADAQFRAGFATLAPRGLSFDAMIYHPQLLELADLARAFPSTTIIVNHIGGLVAHTRTYVARKAEAIENWRMGITALAKCPNVYVKLGGLGMPYLGMGLDKLPAPASSEKLAQEWGPFYQHCIDQFGPARSMFESNFPPDRDSCDYHVIWNAFKRIAAKYSADEKRDLFFGAANQAYRLKVD
ncbi:MAG: amidohydrolase [Betaproteobacteria bacterium]|nr:amidohydrolase [Betaproteobacteria bacterium]